MERKVPIIQEKLGNRAQNWELRAVTKISWPWGKLSWAAGKGGAAAVARSRPGSAPNPDFFGKEQGLDG